jgi:hypothetical protein
MYWMLLVTAVSAVEKRQSLHLVGYMCNGCTCAYRRFLPIIALGSAQGSCHAHNSELVDVRQLRAHAQRGSSVLEEALTETLSAEEVEVSQGGVFFGGLSFRQEPRDMSQNNPHRSGNPKGWHCLACAVGALVF